MKDVCVTLFASVNAGVPYVALDELVTVDPLVPEAVAVFVCEPEIATNGPSTQVAIWLLAASATGKVKGDVTEVALSPRVHAQLAVLTVGSLTETLLKVTSPLFSTTK